MASNENDYSEVKKELLKRLNEKCLKFFTSEEADNSYIFSLHSNSSYENGLDMVAINAYKEKHTYAIYTPEYLKKDQHKIYEVFIKHVDDNEKILTFKKEDYEAMKNLLDEKKIEVLLLE